jgi:hypothetical protein
MVAQEDKLTYDPTHSRPCAVTDMAMSMIFINA